jgi:hypothetical protein
MAYMYILVSDGARLKKMGVCVTVGLGGGTNLFLSLRATVSRG